MAPPPSAETLARSPLHEVIRDYPEVLALLRERGVDPGKSGGETVSVVSGTVPGLEQALRQRVAWRASPSASTRAPSWDG